MTASDLYVIGEGNGSGVVKIGKSGDIKSRFPGLQTGNPKPLQLLHLEPGAGALEKRLHAHFGRIRLHGEWFDFGAHDPVELVVEAIKALSPPSSLYTQVELDRAVAARDIYWQRRLADQQATTAAQVTQLQELVGVLAGGAEAVDSKLFTQLVQDAFVPRMPSRRITPALAIT
jgi:hypothetical protein